jgi:hypothetical protein
MYTPSDTIYFAKPLLNTTSAGTVFPEDRKIDPVLALLRIPIRAMRPFVWEFMRGIDR